MAAVGWFHGLMRRLAASIPGAWLLSRTAHHLDRLVIRISGGRHSASSLLAGIPVVVLTTRGARSGKPHRVPLLGFVDGKNVGLIASNWGAARNPGWYHNLVADPVVRLTVDGAERACAARQADDRERREIWRRAVSLYPGYETYQERAGDRAIPVIVLTPISDPGTAI